VLGYNQTVPGGEIDILARDGETRVAVEVRTTTGQADPIDALDDAKRSRVARLGAMVGADRVDLVGVGIGYEGLDIHWVPGETSR
jgi:Holliday junction resolvase-like predicted endonuclease